MREMSKEIRNFQNESGSFKVPQGYCPDCGAILPFFAETGPVTCSACTSKWNPEEVFGNIKFSFKTKFRDRNTCITSKRGEDDKEKPEGPVVERPCPKCKNDKMSYATLQMRSADEGQTVFYTCTKCKFKETENS